MREIDINIEGYNVNGICVGCLNYDRKMFYSDQVKECFKTLADIDVPDGLSIQVCWECLAQVKSVNRFREQILKSYHILTDYSKKHTFLNSPTDLTVHCSHRLTVTNLTAISFDGVRESKVEEDLAIKTETEEQVYLEINAFSDHEALKPESDYSQDQYFDNFPNNESTDEDIQLSLLKTKKEKKEKKSKKKRSKSVKSKEVKVANDLVTTSRKLKNLPTDLVEICTMTEEQMWQTRTEDLDTKEFSIMKYKCSNCIIGFNTEKLMNYHMDAKHKPKSSTCQQCDVCKAYFLTKDNLSTHRSLHLSAYRCKQCGQLTTLKKHMMKHLRVHSDGLERHECSTCDKVFSTRSKLVYHKNVCHQEKPQCDCCGKVFANKMTLKYHLKIIPNAKEDKPKEKLYIPCKGCNKVFHSKKSYRAHVVIHDGLTYPCPICGKLFQWKRNLARHTRNHRERDAGALHECRECRKTFASRDCYNNHMRLSKRHVPEDLYGHECNYCGKKFATKWCMVDHIDWDHLKRIKYQCSMCFKAFKTAKIMVAHVNNVHGGRRRNEPDGEHLCEICGKSYKTQKRLKGHVWAMHTNRSTTKSFKCKLCPATFTWQTSIYKHTKMMHDYSKKNKQPRPNPPAKKQDYPEMDIANRMQYYQHNAPPIAILPPDRQPETYPILPT